MAGLRLGMAAGVAHYLTLLYWVVYTMHTYGNLPLALCLPVLVLLAAYLSLYTGLFGLGICWLCRSGIRLALLAPALWVALEYLRTVLFTGFPWELLGYAQWQWLPLIQIADITGVYGISFWTVAANAALFLLWSGMAKRPWFEKAVPRAQWVSVAAGFGAVTAAMVGYGAWKIEALETRAAAAPTIRAAVVQANVDQAVKWKPTFQRATTRRYIALSLEASRQSAQLVVWPETATPFYFERNNAFSALIRKAIKETGSYFIIGSPSYAAGKDGIAYFNSAYLIDPQGAVAGRYDKVHLVPFGEYIPLKQFLPFLAKWFNRWAILARAAMAAPWPGNMAPWASRSAMKSFSPDWPDPWSKTARPCWSTSPTMPGSATLRPRPALFHGGAAGRGKPAFGGPIRQHRHQRVHRSGRPGQGEDPTDGDRCFDPGCPGNERAEPLHPAGETSLPGSVPQPPCWP